MDRQVDQFDLMGFLPHILIKQKHVEESSQTCFISRDGHMELGTISLTLQHRDVIAYWETITICKEKFFSLLAVLNKSSVVSFHFLLIPYLLFTFLILYHFHAGFLVSF